MLEKYVKLAEDISYRTLKVSAVSEVGFFFILLAYALTGLTYDIKKMDYFMFTVWIAYFLFSFRLDMNYEI